MLCGIKFKKIRGNPRFSQTAAALKRSIALEINGISSYRNRTSFHEWGAASPENFQSQRGRALIIDIWLFGGEGSDFAVGMGAPRPSLAPLKFSVLSAR